MREIYYVKGQDFFIEATENEYFDKKFYYTKFFNKEIFVNEEHVVVLVGLTKIYQNKYKSTNNLIHNLVFIFLFTILFTGIIFTFYLGLTIATLTFSVCFVIVFLFFYFKIRKSLVFIFNRKETNNIEFQGNAIVFFESKNIRAKFKVFPKRKIEILKKVLETK